MFVSRSIQTNHTDLIHDVAFDFYGRRMATCSSDQFVKIWDQQSDGDWICTAEWRCHRGPAWRVAWAHPEFGQVIATCSFDRTVVIWEELAGSGGQDHPAPHHGIVEPDAALGGGQSTSKSGSSWVKRADLVDPRTSVTGIEFGPKHLGLQLAAVSSDGTLRIYDAMDVMNLSQWRIQFDFPTSLVGSCLSWSKARLHPTLIAIGSSAADPASTGTADSSAAPVSFIAGKLAFYEHSTSNQSWFLVKDVPTIVNEPVYDIAFAPHMGQSFHTLALGSNRLILLRIRQPASALTAASASSIGHSTLGSAVGGNQIEQPSSVSSSNRRQPSSTLANTTNTDGTSRAAGLEVVNLASFRHHNGRVWRVSWNITGTLLASSGDDGCVRLWKANYRGQWCPISVIVPDGSESHTAFGRALSSSIGNNHIDASTNQEDAREGVGEFLHPTSTGSASSAAQLRFPSNLWPVDFLSDYCHWLLATGHGERAVAVWQAVIEFNCFRPPELRTRYGESSQLLLDRFRSYWQSGSPRFGQPGSGNWVGWWTSSSNSSTSNKPDSCSPLPNYVALVGDLGNSCSKDQLINHWASLSTSLEAIPEACEDALLQDAEQQQSTNDPVVDDSQLIPALLLSSSSIASNNEWVRKGLNPSLVSERPSQLGPARVLARKRGRAWVGLEQIRQSSHWLPMDQLGGPSWQSPQAASQAEDQGRFVPLDQVEPALLDLWAAAAGNNEVVDAWIQRLLLLGFEFFGLSNHQLAGMIQLATDLQLTHHLTALSSIQRLSTSTSSISDHDRVWQASRRAFLDAGLEQAARIVTHDQTWSCLLGQLRLTEARRRLSDALTAKQISPKTFLSIWRRCGRSVLAMEQNQTRLDLWSTYAAGFWPTPPPLSDNESSNATLISEGRRVFDSALTQYPINGEQPNDQLLPRLALLHDYIDLELKSAASTKTFNSVIRLLILAVGLSDEKPSSDPVTPSLLARARQQLVKRLDHFKHHLVDQSGGDLAIYSWLGPRLAYHVWLFELVTTGLLTAHQRNLFELAKSILSGLIPLLRQLDQLVLAKDSSFSTRWSSSSDEHRSSSPIHHPVTHRFLQLALNSLDSLALLWHSSRRLLTNTLLDCLMETSRLDLMLWPSDVLMTVDANSPTLSPIGLGQAWHALDAFRDRVVSAAAESMPVDVVGGNRRAKVTTVSSANNQDLFLTGRQLELYAHCLPTGSALLALSWELDRLTGLLADQPSITRSTATNRVKSAFERVLSNPLTSSSLQPMFNCQTGDEAHPSILASLGSGCPSYWTLHLRLAIWRAYMAFGWAASAATNSPGGGGDTRPCRQAVKAVFYRAIEELPWAKILYTDLARFCPEDVDEIVDLLLDRGLRLRVYPDELDLLLNTHPVGAS